MIGTRCVERRTNEAMLDKINERITVMNMIMKRKIKLVDVWLRYNEFISIGGKINGKTPRTSSSDRWVYFIPLMTSEWVQQQVLRV